MTTPAPSSFPQLAKGIFILPKPTPGTPTLPGSIIVTDSDMVLSSAKRLALNGSSPTSATPSPLPKKNNNTKCPGSDQDSACKRKLNFAKLGLPEGHKSSPVKVEKRNARERTRVKTINGTFERLRDQLPCGNGVLQRKKQKKMSKVDILNGAMNYINMLQELITETDDSSPSNHIAAPGSPAASSPSPSTDSSSQLAQLTYTTDVGGTSNSTQFYQNSSQFHAPTQYRHKDDQLGTSVIHSQCPQSLPSQTSFLASLTDMNANSIQMHNYQPPVSPCDSMKSSGSVCSNASDGAIGSSPNPTMTSAPSSVWSPEEQELQELLNFASSLATY